MRKLLILLGLLASISVLLAVVFLFFSKPDVPEVIGLHGNDAVKKMEQASFSHLYFKQYDHPFGEVCSDGQEVRFSSHLSEMWFVILVLNRKCEVISTHQESRTVPF
ncbi:MAG: hypothetical protein AB8B54_05610 [Sphingorhabdus sp.]